VRLNIETTLRGQAKVYATSASVGSAKEGVLEKAQKSQVQDSKDLAQEELRTRVLVCTPLPS
jgi:hypothetical protein